MTEQACVTGRPNTIREVVLAGIVVVAMVTAACGAPAEPDGPASPGTDPTAVQSDPASRLRAIVEDPARPGDDRVRDADRRPADVLGFFGISPGMKVAELMAATGYYTELLAGAVGPDGLVVAHNNRYVLERFAEEPLAARLARLDTPQIRRLDTELDDLQLPPGLDAVLLIRFYHDLYWMPGPDGETNTTDRAAVNRQVFEALAPGGIYGIVDHHAETGTRDRDAVDPRGGLHRIDREMLVDEVLATGFVLDAESDVLANPDDSRDWNIFVDDGARRDRTDRFVLRFRKPVGAAGD